MFNWFKQITSSTNNDLSVIHKHTIAEEKLRTYPKYKIIQVYSYLRVEDTVLTDQIKELTSYLIRKYSKKIKATDSDIVFVRLYASKLHWENQSSAWVVDHTLKKGIEGFVFHEQGVRYLSLKNEIKFGKSLADRKQIFYEITRLESIGLNIGYAQIPNAKDSEDVAKIDKIAEDFRNKHLPELLEKYNIGKENIREIEREALFNGFAFGNSECISLD